MDKLTFLLNHQIKTYFWLITNESGLVIERGQTKNLLDISDKKVRLVEGFIFSPLFSNKRLEVPPATKSQILESIPYLLEDNILRPIKDYHFVSSNRNEQGEVSISLVPKTILDQEVNGFNESAIKVNSLSLLDVSFEVDTSEGFLIIFNELSILSFGSEWGWCSETETVLSILKKSLDEFNCSSLKVFQSTETEEINWDKYIQSDVIIDYVEGELDFLEKALPHLKQNLNILQNQYAPRVDWMENVYKWKYALVAISLMIGLYFIQTIFDIYQNNSSASELLRQSESLYYSSFPEESKEEDISKQLKRKLRNVDFSESEPFLITVQNLTQVIFNNERVSLFSINYDLGRNQFIVEIQCSQFEDLEAVKSTFIQGGYSVDIGSSKRVGNSILSEILIKKS